VGYGAGAARFAGATYDPTSHYRAAAVFDFFAERGLTPALLRSVSQHQISLLAERFDDLDADPALIARDRETPLTEIGGFLVLESPRAGALAAALLARGVHTDHRGTALRLGPAPYLSDRQLEQAIAILGEVIAAQRG
jgi:kynureninase